MCGIYGSCSFDNSHYKEDLSKISKLLNHRGPDNTGLWKDKKDVQLTLYHKRLKIIDRSNKSNQPITSLNNRFLLVYNGEIYNFKELLNKLTNKTNINSDTILLVELWSEFGEKCLEWLEGMYAFTIYDKKEKKIISVRDPFGVKPLYYKFSNNVFYFCSEIEPILNAEKPNLRSIKSYLSSEYYENIEETFFENIFKVKPGNILIFSKKGIQKKEFISKSDLLKPKYHYKNEKDKIELLKNLINEAFNLGIVSDYKLSIATSGGLDSSIINFLVSQKKDTFNKTVSFVFKDSKYSEEYYINEILKFTKLESYKKVVLPEDIFKDFNNCNKQQFEPYAGIPIITYSSCLKDSDSSKVLIDGSGIDEMHLGYNKYNLLKNYDNTVSLDGTKSIQTNIIGKKLNNYDNYDSDLVYDFSEKYKNSQLNDLFYVKLPRALRFRDRLSMSKSIELRPIFLNKNLLSFFFNLEYEDHIRNGYNKFLLRKAYDGKINKNVLWGKKRFVQTPQSDWFKNDLKNLYLSLIDNTPLWDLGWIDKNNFFKNLDLFHKNKINNSFFIWQFINLDYFAKNFC